MGAEGVATSVEGAKLECGMPGRLCASVDVTDNTESAATIAESTDIVLARFVVLGVTANFGAAAEASEAALAELTVLVALNSARWAALLTAWSSSVA